MKQLFYIFVLGIFSPLLSQMDSATLLKIPSTITVPVSLTFAQLEAITNKSLPNLIYQDTSYKDNGDDQLKCKVWKNGTLKMTSNRDNVIDIAVPLKVWVEKGIGAFGLMTYKSTTFQMIMKFTIVYNIHPNWTLMTKTLKNGYVWTQKPSLDFGSVPVPITPIVEKILDENQQDFANTIDEQIKKNMNFKADIVKAWNEVKVPTLVSDSMKTWLLITPTDIKATPFIQRANAIVSNIGIGVITETYMGVKPTTTPNVSTIPNLKYVNALPDTFELFTTSNIPHSDATAIGKAKFVGQDFTFKDGKYAITVDDIAIKGEGGQLVIETLVHGSIKGTIILKGVPYYNEATRSIKMKNLTFDLKTKNIFIKTFAWLFDGKIEQNVAENFDIPTAEIIENSRKSTQDAFNKTYPNNVKMSGRVTSMKPKDIIILSDKMVLVTKTTGALSVKM